MESSCSRVRACEASDNCQFQYRLNSIALLSNSKTIVSRSRFPSSLPCSFPFSAIFRTLSLLLARACACVRTCTRVVEVMLGPGGGVVFSHEYSWGPPPLTHLPTHPPFFAYIYYCFNAINQSIASENCSKERMKMWNRPVRACALVKQVTTVNFGTD